MKIYKPSKSSIFLFEIIINILLFSILLCISLQFFIKSYHLTNDTGNLHQAVTACNNVANIYESGDGSLASVLEEYSHSINTNQQVIIYLDKNFCESTSDDSEFSIKIELLPNDISTPQLHQANISCYHKEELIYSITANQYTQLTLSLVKEVL